MVAATCTQEIQAEGAINGQSSRARGLLLEARALVDGIPEMQRESATANIASQLTRAGNLPEALETVRMLKDPNDQAYAMGNVGWQLVDHGNAAQALALLGNAQDGTGRDSAYQIVALRLAEKQDFQQASQTAHLIKTSDRLSDTLVRIAILQAKADKRADASRNLADALQIVEDATKADRNNAVGFSIVAKARADIGPTSETSTALSRLSAEAHKRKNDREGDFLFQVLAALQAQLGDFAGAMQTVQEISAGSADWVLGTIAEESATHQSIGRALSIAAGISDPNRERTLSRIAIIARSQRKPDESLKVMDEIQDPMIRAEGLGDLALEEANSRHPTISNTLILWQGVTEGGSKATDTARGTIAVAYGLIEDFPNAEHTLSQIAKPDARQWPLWNLTRFLVNQGKEREALDLAQNEKAPLPRLYALLGTAEGLIDGIEADSKCRSERRK